MTRRTVQLLSPLAPVAISFLMLSQANVTAQEGVAAQEPRKSEQSGAEVVRSPSGVVSVKFERGVKISVGNRTTGPIVVVGWDRDYIEASAVSDLGAETVQVWTGSDPSGERILLKADYAGSEENLADGGPRERLRERRQAFGLRDPEIHPSVRDDIPIPIRPPSTNQGPDLTPMFYSRPREIFLEVKIPR